MKPSPMDVAKLAGAHSIQLGHVMVPEADVILAVT